MKSEAQAVIIGGGLLGWRDVVLLESADLTSGSTWHAAGLVGQLRGSLSLTRIMMFSADLYARLGEETGHDPDWRPGGRVDGSGVTFALARGARSRGVEIYTETPVLGITLKNGRVDTVVTARGTIRAPVVVNAAGMWADQIGRMVGVRIPIIPMQHQYLLTKYIEGVQRDLPVLRDPDLRVYCREEVRGLLIGGVEANPEPWAPEGVPPQFHHRLLPPH